MRKVLQFRRGAPVLGLFYPRIALVDIQFLIVVQLIGIAIGFRFGESRQDLLNIIRPTNLYTIELA